MVRYSTSEGHVILPGMMQRESISGFHRERSIPATDDDRRPRSERLSLVLPGVPECINILQTGTGDPTDQRGSMLLSGRAHAEWSLVAVGCLPAFAVFRAVCCDPPECRIDFAATTAVEVACDKRYASLPLLSSFQREGIEVVLETLAFEIPVLLVDPPIECKSQIQRHSRG
jgi:hypothetical protein